MHRKNRSNIGFPPDMYVFSRCLYFFASDGKKTSTKKECGKSIEKLLGKLTCFFIALGVSLSGSFSLFASGEKSQFFPEMGKIGQEIRFGLPVLAQSYYSASIFNVSSTSTSRSVDGTIAGEFDAAIKYYLEFETFAKTMKEAGLTESLRVQDSKDPKKPLFTVFVPTNEAFAALPETIREKLFKPENKDKLIQVLNYHVISGLVSEADVAAGYVRTVEGGLIKIELNATGDKIALNDTSAILFSARATNGVMVSIDRLLLPPDLELD